MASRNQFLADWVKGAYGMELGLAPMLEEQTRRLERDSELHKNLSLHLEKTHQHARLLAERLQRMGEDLSGIRPIAPVTSAIGRVDGVAKPDAARQAELLDYVTETFEVASYRALQSLAEMLGDQETGRVCEQILADELAISDALGRRVPGGNVPGGNGHTDTHTAAVTQSHVTLARELFGALNEHDLDHFERLTAPYYQAELPGRTGPADREQTREWLGGFFKAFPNLYYEINRVATIGDSVFVEWNATGTHSGPFPSMAGEMVPATNRRVAINGVTILRFENGKLLHSKVISDSGSLMRQIGVAPTAQTAPVVELGVGRQIVHFEIPAIDRRITARFYGEMFGWEYEHMDEPMNYTTFRTGNIGGGFPDVNEMNPVGEVTFYVDSDDIEADLRQAESLGGKTVVPLTAIPGYGRFAILADPAGNHFGLYHQDQAG